MSGYDNFERAQGSSVSIRSIRKAIRVYPKVSFLPTYPIVLLILIGFMAGVTDSAGCRRNYIVI